MCAEDIVCADATLRVGVRCLVDEARGDTSVARRDGRGDRSHDGTPRLVIVFRDIV